MFYNFHSIAGDEAQKRRTCAYIAELRKAYLGNARGFLEEADRLLARFEAAIEYLETCVLPQHDHPPSQRMPQLETYHIAITKTLAYYRGQGIDLAGSTSTTGAMTSSVREAILEKCLPIYARRNEFQWPKSTHFLGLLFLLEEISSDRLDDEDRLSDYEALGDFLDLKIKYNLIRDEAGRAYIPLKDVLGDFRNNIVLAITSLMSEQIHNRWESGVHMALPPLENPFLDCGTGEFRDIGFNQPVALAISQWLFRSDIDKPLSLPQVIMTTVKTIDGYLGAWEGTRLSRHGALCTSLLAVQGAATRFESEGLQACGYLAYQTAEGISPLETAMTMIQGILAQNPALRSEFKREQLRLISRVSKHGHVKKVDRKQVSRLYDEIDHSAECSDHLRHTTDHSIPAVPRPLFDEIPITFHPTRQRGY